jgi:5'-nucleotidase
VTRRPVVSSGQYGYNLNRLNFRFNTDTGELVGISQSIVPLQNGDATWTANFPAVPEVTAIVDAANAEAAVLGNQVLGHINGPFNRARTSSNAENRGGESTLGNLVAEVQRWATPDTVGGAQIAFMNPGGLRQDMTGVGTGAFPRNLSYRGAAEVQPFANTLVNMDLTGAQIKATLEQQWQPEGAARPFLRLGASEGFTYTYDDSKPLGSRITHMWLNGTPIELGSTYAVTVNSFLAAGGDNFTALAGGTNKQDTGMTDLQAMVEYMAEFANAGAGDPPLPVDYSQRAVGVKLPAGAPAAYAVGGHVVFGLTSLAMTTAADVNGRDNTVEVSLNGTSLGTFPVTNTVGTALFDEHGTASVDVVVPAGTPGGPATLLVEGDLSGTVVRVPITVAGGSQPPAPVNTTVSGSAASFAYGKTGSLAITVSPATAAGTVTVTTDKGATLGAATITGGSGSLALAAKGLKPGTHTLTLAYAGNSTHKASTGTVSVQVTKPEPKVKVKRDKTVEKGDKSKVVVKVTAPDDINVGGKVKLVIKGTGKSFTAKVVDGKAVFELPAYTKTGTYTLRVKYLGTNLLESVTKKVNVTVVK